MHGALRCVRSHSRSFMEYGKFDGHFNQLLQTSHEDTSFLKFQWSNKKPIFLLNSALVLEAYLLQRSLFYRLFRM